MARYSNSRRVRSGRPRRKSPAGRPGRRFQWNRRFPGRAPTPRPDRGGLSCTTRP